MKRILNVFILIVLLLGCSTKDKELAESHYRMGLAYLGSETDYLSIVEFEKALAINPDDDRVYYAISTFYIKKNRVSDAERYIKRAIELKPNELEYLNLLATIYATRNETLRAIDIWKKIGEDPKYPTPEVIFYNIASAYMQIRNYKEAEYYFKRSIEANPRVLSTYMVLADLYVQQKRFDEAANLYSQVISLNPTFNNAKLQLAKLYFSTNQSNKSIPLLKEIITSEPNSKEAKESIELLKEIGLR
ncbi:MAG: tetratricopeptide repeat protein [Calditerrivibrio sp.]|nr:tetratricopeptide repeat protein [Calditerrivibrio sp.]